MKLTEKQIVILEALARFKYLTSQQLQLIFQNKSASAINTAIRPLNDLKNPLIKSLCFGVLPWYGRLRKVHCLSSSGVKVLTELLYMKKSRIQYPKNPNNFFRRDYFHRISTINFNILMQRWVANQGYNFQFFKLYFNRDKDQIHMSETQVTLGKFKSEPDWIGLYYAKRSPQLFIFEQHNGHDVKRALKQIINHCYGLTNGAVSEAYQIKKPVRIYYVFQYSSCMASVLKRFEEDEWLTKFKGQFFFKTSEQLLDNFEHWWVSPGGQYNRFLPGQ